MTPRVYVPLFMTSSPAVSRRPFALDAVQPPMSISPDCETVGAFASSPTVPMTMRPFAAVTAWRVSFGESPYAPMPFFEPAFL